MGMGIDYGRGVSMRTKYFSKRSIVQVALLAGIATVFLAACGTSDTSNTSATATATVVTAATAVMKHTPSGTVQLMWDPGTHKLMVHLALTGLAPRSTHPARISAGSCKSAGKVVYALTDIKASAIGFANVDTTIAGVTGGIPANGWYIDVHNGPAMSSDMQSQMITCADIVNPTASKTSAQNVQATLIESADPDQAVNGTAQLTLDHNKLTVTLSLKGLAPNTKHAAHIHFGSCASQGRVVYTLGPVEANAAGDANSTTVIANVSTIPVSGWYVNVHRMTDIATQTGFDPIACGDITPVH